ncbi:VOC family protein [Roseobacter sp. YSTF-M11]|uniref:VOC family protein n=1 Tax=Roseobacter insulae TaxID=2859783 RepID=A0A9X1JXT0_9RHOB|nr:VOC family protein [Roseobacter insulae]MBW4707565.1 VOC family protein [Roseobacter insulae]
MQFDHIAIAGETLDEARTYVEKCLGVSLQPGGRHDVFFTHNALLGLEEGLYLEAIAIDPHAETPTRPRWFDLDRFSGAPRLTNWICRTDDIEAALMTLPDGMGAPVSLQRGDLRWRMAVPATGILPFSNCAPALIQWDTSVHPATRLARSGVRLRRLTVQHPHAADLTAMLAPHLHDDRIRYETGPAAVTADFSTPHGSRVLR